MARRGSGAGRGRESYHAGLTPEAVVEEALGMSRGTGIQGWSMRDLAARLGVSASVVHHHVGNREALTARVVGRVLDLVGLPTEAMEWREWFRRALLPARPVLSAYPGTARWLLMHSAALPELGPVVDSGIASVQRAGFGGNSALVFACVINAAMMSIATADDRALHGDQVPADHALLMEGLSEAAAASPGIALLSADMIAQFAGTPRERDIAFDRYYRFVVEAMMDGLELRLLGTVHRPPNSQVL